MTTWITPNMGTAEATNAINATAGTVKFTPGQHTHANLPLRPEITYDLTDATVSLPTNSHRFDRVFTSIPRGSNLPAFDRDAPIATFIGGRITGNADQQDAVNPEHQHGIFVAADSSKPGRMRVAVIGTEFDDLNGDGLSVWKNAEAVALNVTDSGCRRAGLAVTGGNSRLVFENYTSMSGRGLDIEVDDNPDSHGHNGNASCDVRGRHSTMTGKFDVSLQGMGRAEFTDVHNTGFGTTIAARHGSAYIARQCTLGFDSLGDINRNRIVWPGNVEIADSSINLNGPLTIFWGTSGYRVGGNIVRLNRIAARGEGGTAILSHATTTDDRLSIDGLSVPDEFEIGINAFGGSVCVTDYDGPDNFIRGNDRWSLETCDVA